MKITTKEMAQIAMFCAITAVFSQISIPLPFSPVPFSLGILGVMLCGGLLDTKSATLSQILFLLVGAVGLPVFSGMRGGFSAIVGPTGGYLFAYPIAAFLIAFLRQKFALDSFVKMILPMLLSLAFVYLLGTSWLAFTASMTFMNALYAGVVPFALFDLIKAVMAAGLSVALHRRLQGVLAK